MCPNNHSYSFIPRNRNLDQHGCNICKKNNVKQRNFKNKNGFLSENYNLMKIFSLNNIEDPNNVPLGDNKISLFWICEYCNEEYTSTVQPKIKKQTGCPFCNLKKTQSKNEIRIFSEMSYLFNNTNSNYEIEGLKYDIFIEDINLAIEYDGLYWHKNIDAKSNDIKKNKIAKKII